MTLRLLNVTRLSVAMVSGIVPMTEGLRSGLAGVASCGNGRRRREEDRCNSMFAVTGALVDECRRDRCMAERTDWTTQTDSTMLANNDENKSINASLWTCFSSTTSWLLSGWGWPYCRQLQTAFASLIAHAFAWVCSISCHELGF